MSKKNKYLTSLIFHLLQAPENEQEDKLQVTLDACKRNLIGKYLNIDKKNQSEFWSLYEEYQDKKRSIIAGQLEMLTKHDATPDHWDEVSIVRLSEKIRTNMRSYKKDEALFKRRVVKLLGQKQWNTLSEIDEQLLLLQLLLSNKICKIRANLPLLTSSLSL